MLLTLGKICVPLFQMFVVLGLVFFSTWPVPLWAWFKEKFPCIELIIKVNGSGKCASDAKWSGKVVSLAAWEMLSSKVLKWKDAALNRTCFNSSVPVLKWLHRWHVEEKKESEKREHVMGLWSESHILCSVGAPPSQEEWPEQQEKSFHTLGQGPALLVAEPACLS